MWYPVIGLIAVIGAAAILLLRRREDLHAVFKRELAAERNRSKGPQPIIAESDLAALPAPVQRYIRRAGVVGKPRPAAILITFDATLTDRDSGQVMRGPARQYDAFDKPKRLFFMTTRMKGLPVKVLHDYDTAAASMRVRIASLFDAVTIRSVDLARAETVTILNDMCLFAPSWLSDPRLTWTAIDAQRAAVRFVNGPFAVSAELEFDAAGDLAGFTSDDRPALQQDGSLQAMRWSTPVRDVRDFGPCRAPGWGAAVYHYPSGDFTYGEFIVEQIEWLEWLE